MDSFVTIPKFTTDNETLSPASANANWGKVYQNYISTNLTSENLARGAYDAYNLLSASKLHEFQQKSFDTFNKLIDNQSSLASDLSSVEEQLSKTITNLDKFFTSQREGEGVSISIGETISSKNALVFPSNDSDSAQTSYNLSATVRIPLAQGSVPGLVKGFSAGRLDKIIPLFNTEQASISGFFRSTYTPGTPENAPYSQPIELLVWQINYLEYQVAALQTALDNISNGEVKLGHIQVEKITFVSESTQFQHPEVRYITPGQFQTTNK